MDHTVNCKQEANLRWRWRCLEFLPTSWQDVWWSDDSEQSSSSLGFLWTNNNTPISLETDDRLKIKCLSEIITFHRLKIFGRTHNSHSSSVTTSRYIYSCNIVHTLTGLKKAASPFVVLTCLVSGSMRSKNALTVARTSSLHLEHKDRHACTSA